MPAHAQPIQAVPAFKFVNSIGLSTHFDWGPSPYGVRFDEVKSAIGEIGVRHIRQGVGNRSAAARLRSLSYAFGVKLTAVIDARTGSDSAQQLDPGGIAEEIREAGTYISPDMIVAIEGPNEWNLMERLYGRTTWADELRNYQTELFQQVKADAVLQSKPVLGPPLADPMRPEQYAKLGNMEQWADRGNAHIYPNWLSFETKIAQVLPYARLSYPTQRFWVTESGWHTAVNSGTQFIDEPTRMKYLGRAMAGYGSSPDLERVYYYQLVDDEDDPTQSKNNKNMGLMTYGLTRKPSFYAMRNTMSVMCDEALTFAPETLDVSLSGNLADARTLLFQKNNHAFYLVIWLEEAGFYKGAAIDNGAQNVTVSLASPVATIRRYRPTDPDANPLTGHQPKQTLHNRSTFSFPIEDHLTILELVPYGITTPKVATRCNFQPS